MGKANSSSALGNDSVDQSVPSEIRRVQNVAENSYTSCLWLRTESVFIFSAESLSTKVVINGEKRALAS